MCHLTKNGTEEIAKEKHTQRFWNQTYGYQRGNVGGREKLRVWRRHIPTTIYKIDNQQGPPV